MTQALEFVHSIDYKAKKRKKKKKDTEKKKMPSLENMVKVREHPTYQKYIKMIDIFKRRFKGKSHQDILVMVKGKLVRDKVKHPEYIFTLDKMIPLEKDTKKEKELPSLENSTNATSKEKSKKKHKKKKTKIQRQYDALNILSESIQHLRDKVLSTFEPRPFTGLNVEKKMSEVFQMLGLCGSFWPARKLRYYGYAFEATHIQFSSNVPISVLTELRASAKKRLRNMNLTTWNRFLPCIRALDRLEGKLGSKIKDITSDKSVPSELADEFVSKFCPMVESLMREEAGYHTPTSPDKMNHFDESDDTTLNISFLKHRIFDAKAALDAQSVLEYQSHSTSKDIYVTLRINKDDICRLANGSLVYLTPDVVWLFRYATAIRGGDTPSAAASPAQTYKRPLLGLVLKCDSERELVVLKLSRSHMSEEWSHHMFENILRDKNTAVLHESWYVELAVTESFEPADFISWYMENPSTVKSKMPSHMKVIAGFTHMLAAELREVKKGEFLGHALMTDVRDV